MAWGSISNVSIKTPSGGSKETQSSLGFSDWDHWSAALDPFQKVHHIVADPQQQPTNVSYKHNKRIVNLH